MSWVACLSWLAVAGIVFCAAIIGFACWRDHSLRGRRVTNGEVKRECITVSLPNNWLRDFARRGYDETDHE